jgi:hypothetical protein
MRPISINFARPAILLPMILLINLLFASYFLNFDILSFNLNPFAAPEPYRSLFLIAFFYACTLTLTMNVPWGRLQTQKMTLAEENDLKAYLFSAETVLMLIWWYRVLFFAPADGDGTVGEAGKQVEWWTTGRSVMLGLTFVISMLLAGIICAVRTFGCTHHGSLTVEAAC